MVLQMCAIGEESGSIIGGIVVSMYLPIFKLGQVV
jgi:type II secretory pathway component PulF